MAADDFLLDAAIAGIVGVGLLERVEEASIGEYLRKAATEVPGVIVIGAVTDLGARNFIKSPNRTRAGTVQRLSIVFRSLENRRRSGRHKMPLPSYSVL